MGRAIIEPYDKSVYNMSILEKNEWANTVINQLGNYSNINEDEFIFLTDDFYCQEIYIRLKNYKLPLKGLDQKEHLDWFNKVSNKKGCENDTINPS